MMATTLPLPVPFAASSQPIDLITQGAEAFVYRTTFLTPDRDCALKYRPSKPYRHPILDKRLTRQRILAEARVLAKCKKDSAAIFDSQSGPTTNTNSSNNKKKPKPSVPPTQHNGGLGGGVHVPAVLGLDWEAGWLATEWIQGRVVRHVLQTLSEAQRAHVTDLLRRIGDAVGKLHDLGVVHGDLTTSNIMLRPVGSKSPAESEKKNLPIRSRGNQVGSIERQDGDRGAPPVTASVTQGSQPAESSLEDNIDHELRGDIVLIDFGLAQQTQQEEDRAVDLYVLERAFGSTHPESEHLFDHLLDAYASSYQGAKIVVKRLADVRMRGRKKSMLG